MTIRIAAVDNAAVQGNQERNMGAPAGERAFDAARPHRRMSGGADLAKEMRSPCVRIEARRGLPIKPADIVLFRREQKWLVVVFVPCAQQLARKPSVGDLADRENARRLIAKE